MPPSESNVIISWYKLTLFAMLKKYWFLVAIAVVMTFLFLRGGGYEGGGPLSSVSPTATPAKAKYKAPGVTKYPTPLPSVSGYSEAVKQYEGRRIQFDQYCQANPVSSTYKNGTTIMLDNRSGDPRIVQVDGKSYNLAGYGYKLVSLSSTTLPQTYTLNCGSAVNVGKILLQK